MQELLVLALFVTAENRDKAMANLAGALEGLPEDTYTVLEFNLSEYPQLAECADILVTPTLVRYWPLPKVQVLGDLADPVAVRNSLKAGTDTLVHKLFEEAQKNQSSKAREFRTHELNKLAVLSKDSSVFSFKMFDGLADTAEEIAACELQRATGPNDEDVA